MEQLLDKLVEGTCGEASPVVKLIQELNWLSDDVDAWDEEAQTESQQESSALPISAKTDQKSFLPSDKISPSHESLETYQGSQIGNQNQMGTNALQTLFLTEPQFFRLVLEDFGEKQAGLTPSDVFQDNIFPQFSDEKGKKIEEGHHDDCTPSSGPDYLMEIQNPTWETAVYSKMTTTLQEISNDDSSLPTRSCQLQDFSNFFLKSLLADKSKYTRDSTAQVPNSQDPLTLAKSLMAEGKIVESVPFLENALQSEVADKTRETWTLLALAQYLVQNDAQAISACKQYLKLESSNEDSSSRNLVLLLLATCLLNEGDTMACQATIFQWATAYLRFDEAKIREFLTPSDQNICSISGRNWTSTLLNIFENYSASKGMLSDGTLNWAMAVLYFSTDDFIKAGRCFERVLVQNPTSPSVLNQIGACLHNSHQFEKAISLFEKALEVLEGFPRALYNKATTLHAMGKTEEALILIESALDRQHRVTMQPSDQFWYLAARLVPRLPAKLPDQHRRRTKLMSTILTRNLKEFKENLKNRNIVT